ncbi:MAG: dihydroneopterin aldolase [Tannerellaceae bacterium]|nr:dihydroneopterin aldolase [Tannerellaceae bacterium]MCD8264631.1 dihydroneopterin aldolase [Tannerellaceae bacterium]
MITKIELKGMQFYTYHGVFPQERKVGNTFTVDLLLTAPLNKAVQSDDLADTLNYAEIYAVVKKEMDIPSNLLEYVAGRILTALKKNFPQLLACEIKLAKQNPPFGGDIQSAAIILSEIYN